MELILCGLRVASHQDRFAMLPAETRKRGDSDRCAKARTTHRRSAHRDHSPARAATHAIIISLARRAAHQPACREIALPSPSYQVHTVGGSGGSGGSGGPGEQTYESRVRAGWHPPGGAASPAVTNPIPLPAAPRLAFSEAARGTRLQTALRGRLLQSKKQCSKGSRFGGSRDIRPAGRAG